MNSEIKRKNKHKGGSTGSDPINVQDPEVAHLLRELQSANQQLLDRIATLEAPEPIAQTDEEKPDTREESFARQISKDLKRTQQTVSKTNQQVATAGGQIARNVYAGDIPPWSAVEITGVDTDSGVNAITVTRPTAENLEATFVAFTSQQGIPEDGLGYVYSADQAWGKTLLYGTIAAGQEVGTVANQFYLQPMSVGAFNVLGKTDDSMGGALSRGYVRSRGGSGGLTFTEVAALPDIPDTGIQIVRWLSSGTGDDGMWVGVAGNTDWFPWGHLTDKDGTP